MFLITKTKLKFSIFLSFKRHHFLPSNELSQHSSVIRNQNSTVKNKNEDEESD
jgi:hypothetical protein